MKEIKLTKVQVALVDDEDFEYISQYGWYNRKDNNKYQSGIVCNKKRIHLGCFNTPEEAAIAYNNKAIEIFGEYAKLNVIESGGNYRT